MFLTKKKEKEESFISLRNVSLQPSIHALNLLIPKGAWVLLYGPDSLGIALFCDLCFGFLEPDGGTILNSYQSHDVGFLGRSATTYGRSLLEHVQCSVSNTSKEEILRITDQVLSQNFRNNLASLHQPIESAELSERESLELGEANFLLQKKPAIVIDTSSEFYQQALLQGFQHSSFFLNSGKTIFWICSERGDFPVHIKKEQKPPIMDLFFSLSPHGGGIN